MNESQKTREGRARRAAKRQGLRLIKARRFDPAAYDYGLYVLVPDKPNAQQVAARKFTSREGLTLDQVEEQLRG